MESNGKAVLVDDRQKRRIHAANTLVHCQNEWYEAKFCKIRDICVYQF